MNVCMSSVGRPVMSATSVAHSFAMVSSHNANSIFSFVPSSIYYLLKKLSYLNAMGSEDL